MVFAVDKRLVVQEIDQDEEKKEGLLIIPHRREQTVALVISCGSKVDEVVGAGDRVLLPPDTGIPFIHDGKAYLSILENQILAVFKEGEEEWAV